MEAKVMDGSSDLEVIDLRNSVSILIAKYLQNHKLTNSENLQTIFCKSIKYFQPKHQPFFANLSSI